uniref:Uncharacterized protein n=1 Tax=Mus musculus TaxID=10090 RepID=Q3UMZ2_MOUSE|nr:unnamed protein product [Mus musculus]
MQIFLLGKSRYFIQLQIVKSPASCRGVGSEDNSVSGSFCSQLNSKHKRNFSLQNDTYEKSQDLCSSDGLISLAATSLHLHLVKKYKPSLFPKLEPDLDPSIC